MAILLVSTLLCTKHFLKAKTPLKTGKKKGEERWRTDYGSITIVVEEKGLNTKAKANLVSYQMNHPSYSLQC